MNAIGYVSNIVLPTDEVISIEEQKEKILNFVKKFNINLIEIIEEDDNDENVLERNGFKSLCKMKDSVDVVLTERVWSLTKKMKDLQDVFDNLEEKPIYSTTNLWDCVSQVVRRRYKNFNKKIFNIEKENKEKTLIR